MLYILGGVSRSGKSLIAQRALREQQIFVESIDLIKMGLCKGLTDLKIDPEKPSEEVANRIWPVVNAMMHTVLETKQSYLFEGDALMPTSVVNILREWPNEVRVCFLGYSSVDVEQKLNDIKTHNAGPNNWISDYSDDQIRSHIIDSIQFSKTLVEMCANTGISYFDTSQDFRGELETAYKYLFANS
jgi:hypothetical protein